MSTSIKLKKVDDVNQSPRKGESADAPTKSSLCSFRVCSCICLFSIVKQPEVHRLARLRAILSEEVLQILPFEKLRGYAWLNNGAVIICHV
jgi:hypothetical protein